MGRVYLCLFKIDASKDRNDCKMDTNSPKINTNRHKNTHTDRHGQHEINTNCKKKRNKIDTDRYKVGHDKTNDTIQKR